MREVHPEPIRSAMTAKEAFDESTPLPASVLATLEYMDRLAERGAESEAVAREYRETLEWINGCFVPGERVTYGDPMDTLHRIRLRVAEQLDDARMVEAASGTRRHTPAQPNTPSAGFPHERRDSA